jgi:hypothetical protein
MSSELLESWLEVFTVPAPRSIIHDEVLFSRVNFSVMGLTNENFYIFFMAWVRNRLALGLILELAV